VRYSWILLVCMGCGGSTPAGTLIPTDDPGLEPLSWLAGSWLSVADDAQTEEHWSPPRAGTMLGMNRTVSGSRTTHYEFLMIEREGEEIVYTARPSGQAEASFRAGALTNLRIVFENPKHDFPKRITYEADGDDAFVAHLEGVEDGKPRTSEWRFERARVR
jgi:hypothetical protein